MVLSPQNWPHASATDRTYDLIRDRFGSGFWVRMQLPLALGEDSDPEPDVSVVVGKREDYSDHPTTAALVIEVADSSLAYDSGEKAEIYAASRIPEYWVLDLNHRQLIVFRDPLPGTASQGYEYADRFTVDAAGTINPIAAPHVQILVADMLG